tara:strand:+ start:247 stop:1056 length:810 start_codon:yes stop_codon:yes gene_type:complete
MKNLSRKREKEKEERIKTKPKIPAPAPAREPTRRNKLKLKNAALIPTPQHSVYTSSRPSSGPLIHPEKKTLSYYRALERDFRTLYTRVDDVVEPRLRFLAAVRDISEGDAMDEKEILAALNENEIDSFRNFRGNERIRMLLATVSTLGTNFPRASETEAEKSLRLVLETENPSGKIYGKLLDDKYREWERGQELLLQEMRDKHKEIMEAQTASKIFAIDFFDVQNTGWRFAQTRRRRRRSTRSRRRNINNQRRRKSRQSRRPRSKRRHD